MHVSPSEGDAAAMADASKKMAFARIFDAEFLGARKDITPVMLAAAKGQTEVVRKYLKEENPFEIYTKNRDGNTLLLLAVANKHIELTKLLLEVKSDVEHKNLMHMDALDYATVDGIRNPLARAVFSFCDYVLPDVIDGDYFITSTQNLSALNDEGVVFARSSLCGRLPNFENKSAKDNEHTTEWLKSMNFMVNAVGKGLLILSHEVGFIERDAVLSGALEISPDQRFVYFPNRNGTSESTISFRKAMEDPQIYKGKLEKRLIAKCHAGEDLAVRGLLKASASANVEDAFGQSALMKASQRGEYAVMHQLLMAKANPNATNKDGYTALHLAAVANKEDAVKLLLNAHADPTATSYKGNSVLAFVKYEGHKNILHIIRDSQKNMPAAGRSASRARRFRPPSRAPSSRPTMRK